MTRVSIISHANAVNVFVREGKYCVELAGKRPWCVLMKAMTILKYREAIGYCRGIQPQLTGAVAGIKHFARTIRQSLNG